MNPLIHFPIPALIGIRWPTRKTCGYPSRNGRNKGNVHLRSLVLEGEEVQSHASLMATQVEPTLEPWPPKSSLCSQCGNKSGRRWPESKNNVHSTSPSKTASYQAEHRDPCSLGAAGSRSLSASPVLRSTESFYLAYPRLRSRTTCAIIDNNSVPRWTKYWYTDTE